MSVLYFYSIHDRETSLREVFDEKERINFKVISANSEYQFLSFIHKKANKIDPSFSCCLPFTIFLGVLP